MKKILTTLVCIFMFLSVFSANTMFPPTLTTPTNGAINQMPNPFLKWSAVPGAFKYKIQVSTDSLFATSLIYSTNLTGITSANLFFNTKYFWRVKAIGTSDSSAWCIAGKFYTLTTITLINPTDSSTNRPVSCYFKWNAITGITGYEYQMDTSLTFSSPLFVTSIIPPTKIEAYSKQLAFGEHYYLRIRARHTQDTTAWSSLLNLYTLTDFSQHRPQTDTTKVMTVTKFEWDWVGSKFYSYTLATDSLFTSNVSTITVDTTKVVKYSTDTLVRVLSDTLLFGRTYFWKVQAKNALDTSNFTAVWKFATINKVTILTPLTNSINVTTIPTFTWTALSGIGNYLLELDTNQLFSNPTSFIIPNSTTTYTIALEDHLLPLTKYYWRMKATTLIDSTDWSDVFNLKTTTPLDVETLDNNTISIFPNPSLNGIVNLQINSTTSTDVFVSLINMVGQEILNQNYSIKSGSNLISLDLKSNQDGIYFIKFKQGDNIITRKIILNK
ncbi:MAG: T9SS type A sorting domain-containing protein [Bacteroidota bacterium]